MAYEEAAQLLEPRVLIVDDEPIQRLIIARCAQKIGWSADEASTLSEARQQLETRKFRAVVIDLCLGEEDGLALLHMLRKIASNSIVVFVSGADERVLAACFRVARSMGLRVSGTLRKPIQPHNLHAMLLANPSRSTLAQSGLARPTAEQFAQALDRGEVYAEFQPKVDLRTSRLIGVEALARWRCPELGYVAPELFVPVAEEAGLVNRLTQRILSQAIALCERCRQHQSDFSVAVNISPMLLSNEHFPAEIEQTLLDGNLPAGALVLEVTESTMVLNPSLATEVLTRLSIKGVRFSIDDFGTGHSSLVSLLRSPFAELKIDRSFVEVCQTDLEAWKIISAVLSLAHELGMRVVAEGIESRLTSEMLREAGCDIGQGWFFGRPMKRHKVLHLV